MADSLPPPLPDFQVAEKAAADLSRELGRCANLPTFQQGNMILDEIRGLRNEVRGLRNEVREMKTQMMTMFMASNDNNIARLHNSQISRSDQPMMALRSLITNEPIPSFPETVDELQRLPNAVVVEILRELGTSTDGNAGQKKLRLRLQCGLKREPI